mgnify:CR=1 FL=1
MKLISITKSDRPEKKLKAVFELDNGRTKTTHFGARGMNDYTIYSKSNKKEAEKHKKAYIARHQVNEDFNNPTSSGSLSRFILWNKATLSASIADFKRRFNL